MCDCGAQAGRMVAKVESGQNLLMIDDDAEIQPHET